MPRQTPTRLTLTLAMALVMIVAAPSTSLLRTTNAAVSSSLSFGPPRSLGQAGRNASSPFLRNGPRDRLYATWIEDDPGQPAESKQPTAGHRHKHPGMFTFTMRTVLLAFSDDGAKTWSSPRRVNSSMEAVQGDEDEPKLALAADGRAAVVWSTPNAAGDKTRSNVRFAMDDGRGGFTPARSLNEVKDTARFPIIERAPDDTLLVTWIDRRVDSPATRALYVMRLGAGGSETLRTSKIGEDACECCRLGMAFANGGRTVYLTHRHVTKESVRNLVLLTSTDGGSTFGSPAVISDDGWVTGCPHSGPTLALDQRGSLHITWFTLGRTPQEAGIYYAVSSDGGRTFTPRQLVHANTAPEILHTRLAVWRDGTMYFAWDNLDTAGKSQIFVRSLAADGRTWSAVQQLSHAAQNASRPALSVTDQNVHVAWTESDGEKSSIVMRSAGLTR